jgi:hypothetical protein
MNDLERLRLAFRPAQSNSNETKGVVRERCQSVSEESHYNPPRPPLSNHILTLGFFWRMTAGMRRQKGFSEQQRSLTQIIMKRTVGSEFCCNNSEGILRLRTNSSALSRLIPRMRSPISISTARQVAQGINKA